ncbi:MAG TPA: thioredoxin domain-containing protein [Candidatus Dormibacteraeota bacterium]|nr:thioredoxin domain-containing protein [Candidatus Dormibacteraeota bacterium]
MSKRTVIFIFTAASLAIGGAYLWIGSSKDKNTQTTPAPTTQQPQTKKTESAPELIIGNPNAKVTILEYSDPQCPICLRFFETTEPQLKREYLDTGKAKLQLKVETHIGANSKLAGQAWYCAAEQNQFAAYHDETFRRQRSGINETSLKQIAGQIGLNQNTFDQCLESGKYAAQVEADNTEAQSRISGTPTFFIGTQKVVGAQPFSVFKTIIDSQL